MDTDFLESGKQVLLSDPYTPKEEMLAPFRGRDRELAMICASWMRSAGHPPLCPLMVGEPGVGKNRIVYALAALTGLKLYILQGHEDITAEDLACTVRFADQQRMEYVLSPLVTAMHKGGICFIDEIGKIRPRALALLVSVVDERRYIDSTLLGERITAKDDFRFAAATNAGEEYELPEFLRSRLKPVVKVDLPDKEEIADIVGAQIARSGANRRLLNEFSELWSRRGVGRTPREALQVFALAESLSLYRTSGPEGVLGRGPGGRISKKDLKEAFDEIFGATEG